MESSLSKLAGRMPAGIRSSHFRMMSPAAFLEVSADEVDRAQRYGRPLSVGIVLINRLVMIRKSDGIEVAQSILDQVAMAIMASFRGPDKVGRLGPGELGVLMPETNQQSALVAAKRLRELIATRPFETEVGTRGVTLNIGIAGYSPRMRNVKTFLMAACHELRRARNEGPDKIAVSDGDRVRLSMPRSKQVH